MDKKDISRIILGTGSYDMIESGNTVSITGDGGNAWGYYGPSYKKLAPKLETYLPYAEKYKQLQELKDDLSNLKKSIEYRKQIEDEYIKSYYDIRLKNLNVYELLEELRIRFGKDIILLCHEPIDEFCHRRLFADYIELKTGLYIPEISIGNDGKVKKIIPIRYKNRLKEIIYKAG